MNNKNTFHHITSAELEAETDTLLDDEIAIWLDAFIKDLSRIKAEKCTTALGKKMIQATFRRIERGELRRRGEAA
jgi:hypothetical protein